MHFELYLLALAGVAIHYFKDWVNHNQKNLKYGWEKAVPMAALSVITSLLLVYLREDIAELFVITPFSAVVLGYTGNSVFFSFVDAKKPKIDEQQQP
jgi:predicted ABC-type exoprotein transport system permease subunit